MQRQRLASGGRLDRSKKIAFQFDGKRLTGYAGDTLASALLANGVRLVGRSFKYHRPRGLYAAGVEEPNALVELRKGAHKEPNTLATVAELFDGLVANSQNNWPSLRFDLMGVSNRLSPLLAVGFYYKTFMWPRRWWLRYESLIRKAAGMGAASSEPDPDSYEHAHDFCDVLVVGAGPAGIAAAVAAVEAGARTILVEQDFAAGGSLLAAAPTLDGDSADDWLRERLSYLDRHEAARVMLRTTAFGCYDHNVVGLIERVSDHVTKPPAYRPRQRLWTVRAEHLIVAAGSFERPFVFANNDLPGVMLASAAKTYCRRFAVRPGGKAVVFTNNDSAYTVIDDLLSAGVRVEAVVDTRSVIDAQCVSAASRHGTEILNGFAVTEAGGKRHLKRVTVHPFDGRGIVGHEASRTVDCDLLLMSAGWSPTLHLHSQTGAKPVYAAAIAGFVPGESAANHHVVGAAAGLWGFEAVIESGRLAGRSAATGRQCDIPGRALRNAINVEPLWEVPSPKSGSVKKFVDLQNDVTASDIRQAEGEGYGSAEHLKRYTALAMGTDQGKLSAVNGMALMAAARRVPISDVGTTTFRPPFTPVAVGALAGRVRGKHYRPARVTPMHCWHDSNGARLMQTGAWLRPQCYLRNGESEAAAYRREAAAVRSTVGLVDISSLGKIDVQGPDAGEFLDRVYVNKWRTFRVNRAKYGVMLRDDGIVLDDGTTSRISEDHYFMTTTTANESKVLEHLEFLLDIAWPTLRVHVTSVTDQWAGAAVAGPRSRDLLLGVVTGCDLGNESFRPMSVGHGEIAGCPVRICRLSYSGELAFEVYTPAGFGETIWSCLIEQGRPFGLTVYGNDALNTLRIEKGHVAGPELDGRTTLGDLGLAKMGKRERPFVGSVLMNRPGLLHKDRPRLVGLRPRDAADRLVPGALLFPLSGAATGHGVGRVTSATFSPALQCYIGLGLVSGGAIHSCAGLKAANPVENETVIVDVVSPVFVDPEGKRSNA